MTSLHIQNLEPAAAAMQKEVLACLKQTPKQLPAKFTYDEEGARLFEQLGQTEEYYLTQTELGIMRRSVGEIAACLPEPIALIEYGSGNSQKTRLLFENLPQLIAYIPIDLSRAQLLDTSQSIARDYPSLEVLPVCADYDEEVQLPTPTKPFARRLFFYPGSTIGNLHPPEAVDFLRRIVRHCQPGDGLLIGFDLRKETAILTQAYNDRSGNSIRFNRHILERLNRELDADFDIPQYEHHVQFDDPASRIEIYLRSRSDQTVAIGGERVHFRAGELIKRAVAYKYSLHDFAQLTTQAGWQTQQSWTDNRQWFAVQLLTATE